MRLAWFSPWPPQASGIAGRSAELVPELCRRGMGIDIFVDEREVEVSRGDDVGPRHGRYRVQSAHDFVWRARRGQYDLAVYQVGNSRLHDYIWPYLFRWPGLAVLHDARLHHARARSHMQRRAFDAYREEFRWNHPGTDATASELGVAGFGGSYFYLWPMLRAVVESSRLVASHSRGAIAGIVESLPADSPARQRPVEYIALGEGRETQVPDDVRRAERARLGYGDEHVVFGVFGGLSAEKRVEPIARCLSRLRHRIPHVRLLVGGSSSREFNLVDLIRRHSLSDITSIHDAVDDETFDRLIACVDVSLNLRWPTALETSGPWLRALAAGRASIVIALAHQSHVPALDPRVWLPWPGQPGDRPITIALDILDEDHSLALAMERLAEDKSLRRSLGASARSYWEQTHTVCRMADDYERVLSLGMTTLQPDLTSPAFLRPDPLAVLNKWLGPLAVANPFDVTAR